MVCRIFAVSDVRFRNHLKVRGGSVTRVAAGARRDHVEPADDHGRLELDGGPQRLEALPDLHAELTGRREDLHGAAVRGSSRLLRF